MTIYETVKSAVTVRQAAEHYGLQVGRNNMTCCPFHKDRHPSMKLYDDHFYCFGCGAMGDVIDFTARLFGISAFEAVKKLAADFGIDPDKPPAAAALAKPKYPMIKAFREDELYCHRVLCDYLHLLENWKVQYAPKTPEEPCPADRGRTAQRKGYCRQQEKADVVAGRVLEAHGQEVPGFGARRECR